MQRHRRLLAQVFSGKPYLSHLELRRMWLWINTYENTINIVGWTSIYIPFVVGWTSINPSYFDVNYRGTRFWHTAMLVHEWTQIQWLIIGILSNEGRSYRVSMGSLLLPALVSIITTNPQTQTNFHHQFPPWTVIWNPPIIPFPTGQFLSKPTELSSSFLLMTLSLNFQWHTPNFSWYCTVW